MSCPDHPLGPSTSGWAPGKNMSRVRDSVELKSRGELVRKRRRECSVPGCSNRWNTYEVSEDLWRDLMGRKAP